MPRNDQAVRQLIVLKKLESSRHGLTLEQLAEGLDPSTTRHARTLRRDLYKGFDPRDVDAGGDRADNARDHRVHVRA